MEIIIRLMKIINLYNFLSFNLVDRIKKTILYWFYEETDSKISPLENEILSIIDQIIERKLINLPNGQQIWTISTSPQDSKSKTKSPIVLLHGLASGSALWSLNLKALASHRTVYALDLPGFARSNRLFYPNFEILTNLEKNKLSIKKELEVSSKLVHFASNINCTGNSLKLNLSNEDANEDVLYCERMLAETLEQWRQAINIDNFILLGHCFGAYVGACYLFQYSQHVKHFIPLNPWGFAIENSLKDDYKITGIFSNLLPQPFWIKSVSNLLSKWNPLAILRLVGSKYGPSLVMRFMSDFIGYYNHYIPRNIIAKYIYFCNSRKPTGETLYRTLATDCNWSKYPILPRINDIPSRLAMTFIFGSRSYINSNIGQTVRTIRNNSYVDIQIINGSGHYLFAEKPDLFNVLINKVCLIVDHQLDSVKLNHRRFRSESTSCLTENQVSSKNTNPFRICNRLNQNQTSAFIPASFEEDDEMIIDEENVEKPVFNICLEN